MHRPSAQSQLPLPGLPRGPISPAQQLDALRRLQTQAEQRVAVGRKLLKALGNRAACYQEALEELKGQQAATQQQIQEQVRAAATPYTSRIAELETQMSRRLEQFEARLSLLEQQWSQQQERTQSLLHRAEALLDEGRYAEPQQVKLPPPRPTARPAGSPAPPAPATPAAAAPAAGHDRGETAAAPKSIADTIREGPIYSRLLEKLQRRSEGRELEDAA